MTSPLVVRPFCSASEYERMIAYFADADEPFLLGMGVDRARLPAREAWLEAVLRDHECPNHEKDRAYLAWVYDGVPIGHSSINKISVGQDAFIHLHLWIPVRRRQGLGLQFFELSAQRFVRDFSLSRLYCEPYAHNPAPNRVVLKAGFRLVKRYRTVPGPINFEQDVNLYLRDFPRPHADPKPVAREN
jgi:RimJ/RimL family protein N-acetyltransferase